MAETVETFEWPIGNRIAVSWGNPKRPNGSTGLKDAFVTGEEAFINEAGVVTLASVVDEDGVQLSGLGEDLVCEYLAGSRGMHFYVLDTPETYGLAVGDLATARLKADAAVLIGEGKGERVLRLAVVDRF